ncbi:MAG TPA: molybdenum cofactor guanylyltransferase MobA [Thermopetrobacter sp.]|nr:molybdenum cofactor guanylyltransferase MobA [Thermopetrobacter sp.]
MSSGANADIAAVILAGGRARRFDGRHKAFLPLAGKPLIAHVIARLTPQVGEMAISANERAGELARHGLPVLPDPLPGFAGPLAGVLAGLRWARGLTPRPGWLLSVAVDTPFFPPDLAARLRAAAQSAEAPLAVAASGGRRHPVFGLWALGVAGDLARALIDEDLRKIDLFTARHRLAVADFPVHAHDPFFNINRPDDLDRAAQLARPGGRGV